MLLLHRTMARAMLLLHRRAGGRHHGGADTINSSPAGID
jgi:hypothetical protein